MGRRLARLALTFALLGALLPPAAAAASLRPPVTWLKGEGNYTKAHRTPQSLESIVVHVTEGAFWGSVRWLRNPRAHASSHFVVARSGRIIQLVHVSDIAWHAGNRRVNRSSVGIEHEGFTNGRDGFTDAQYESSARLAAWLARRALMPIDREHLLGHADVPAPGGGRGGSSHHTDPGPRWRWARYLELVRRYAHGRPTLSVVTRLPRGPLAGIVPWRAETGGGVRYVEFAVDGRVVWTDRRAPFAFAGGRGLNTTSLRNGAHVLELRAYGDGTRHDVTRSRVVVRNRPFRLVTAGAREWSRVRGLVRLRATALGASARGVVLRVNGRRVAADARAPYILRWDSRRVRDRMHVLELSARALDGRTATARFPVVVRNRPARPKRTPPPRPAPPPKPKPKPLAIAGQSVHDGQAVEGLVLWRVLVDGRAERVDFVVDGTVRGTDVAAPYTFGWNAALEVPGDHVLTARARGAKGRTVSASVVVTVPAAPAPAGSEAP